MKINNDSSVRFVCLDRERLLVSPGWLKERLVNNRPANQHFFRLPTNDGEILTGWAI